MPTYIVKRLQEALAAHNKTLAKSKILIIGVTYKKDVKDLRKSPALDVIDILQKRRVRVDYHDPVIPYLKFGNINLRSINLNRINPGKFDCAVIIVDHSGIDYDLLLKKSALIFDTRNIYAKTRHKKVVRL